MSKTSTEIIILKPNFATKNLFHLMPAFEWKQLRAFVRQE